MTDDVRHSTNTEKWPDGYPAEIKALADKSFHSLPFVSKNGVDHRGMYDCGFLHGFDARDEEVRRLTADWQKEHTAKVDAKFDRDRALDENKRLNEVNAKLREALNAFMAVHNRMGHREHPYFGRLMEQGDEALKDGGRDAAE